MFTGIIEELGTVLARNDRVVDEIHKTRLTVHSPIVTEDTHLGESIAVNGVCLTVVELDDAAFSVDVIQETLNRSTMGTLETGDTVNIERAMRVGARLDGHIVQGHVDGMGTVVQTVNDVFRISIPDDLAPYIVEKGSVALDGVSLTVSAIGHHAEGRWLEVSLIPATLALTTFGHREVGDSINIEVDILAKYVRSAVESYRN